MKGKVIRTINSAALNSKCNVSSTFRCLRENIDDTPSSAPSSRAPSAIIRLSRVFAFSALASTSFFIVSAVSGSKFVAARLESVLFLAVFEF